MPAVLDHMAVGIAVAVSRGNHGRIAEQPDLSAVGVPDRVSVTLSGTLGKMSGSWASRIAGASPVTFASVPSKSSTPRWRAAEQCELVAEAEEPERAALLLETQGIVLHDRNADGFQLPPCEDRPSSHRLRLAILPPIVVAQDGVDAERGPQRGGSRREVPHRYGTGDEAMSRRVIAEEHDEIGIESVRRRRRSRRRARAACRARPHARRR